MKYKVVEKFTSINGEGQKSGELAIFIRLQGCNLNCDYCDTWWANQADVNYDLMSKEAIHEYIMNTKVKNVTLTGGEPLATEKIHELLLYLSESKALNLEVETNGSISLKKFLNDKISFTMDYKLPSSMMENHMALDNLKLLKMKDTLKFVIGSREDLIKAKQIICDYELINQTKIYFSPVFDKIEPCKIVEFMIKHNLNGIKMQLQMHKFIWDKNKKGV